MNDVASATRRPCCSRSSAGPISGAMTANGAMVISRYSATLLLLSPLAAAKNSVLANATAIAASTAKFATTGHVSAVSPDLSAPSAVAARCTRPYIFEPISRLRCAAALVTVTFWPAPAPTVGGGVSDVLAAQCSSSGGSHRLALGMVRRERRDSRSPVAGVVGHPGMLVTGRAVARVTGRTRREIARVTPRSGHRIDSPPSRR